MTPPDRFLRQRFLAEVSQADEEINLARAAIMVAKEEYPQLPEERYLGCLDLLAEGTRDRLDDENAHLVVFQELLNSLYNRHGFRGNRQAYYDPRNSFLKVATKREMLVRLLMNMKSLYLNVGDHRRALAAVERVLLIRPITPQEIRDRGVILARSGRKQEALEQLEAYLNVAPEAADSQRILGMVEELKNGSGQAPRP